MCSFKTLKIILSSFITLFFSNQAFSAENMGAAHPWGLNLREPFSSLMAEMVSFHNGLIWLITIISLFVLALLVIIVVKFNAKANPKPSKTTHNTFLEIAWTAIPVLILVIMAVPSFKLLYKADVVPESYMTVKAIGHQWYWSYEYPDHGNFTYDAWMIQEKEDIEGENRPYTRLLTTDTRVVVPVGKVIKVQIASTDVIHSWAVPSLGIKKDAVPGRLNELWLQADREGIFYGQCSELCGLQHGYMPIEVHAVSEEEFLAWVEEAKENYDMVGNNLNLAKIKE
ncbi:MAG: cytochrome c oxidase subunit II [Pelagibacterales bacterium]|jgi:cytochrome c oxidase subunit 2|nr:cytochrome c oxidase subunit II [Pelagibacterales bacterium]MBT4108815.1 cytochrome c oxidase subunit II [Pelagibacterales bacterium]